MQKQCGFTLVEILIAIAVIGLLATVVLVSGGDARAKARDTQRISDLQQIRLALRAYAEQYGEYPCENENNCNAPGQTTGAGGQLGVGVAGLDNLLAPTFIREVPADPRHDGSEYYYFYDGNHYCEGSDTRKVVLFAKTMETEEHKNHNATICESYGGAGDLNSATDAHVIIISETNG